MHVHWRILQHVCCFLWGVSPIGAVLLELHLSSLVFSSASARTYDDTPKRVLFFVRSRPFWSSTTIVKPFQSCLSFCWCQYNYNYPFLVLLFLPPAHTPSPAGMVHRTRMQIKWILSLIQACYCTNSSFTY